MVNGYQGIYVGGVVLDCGVFTGDGVSFADLNVESEGVLVSGD